MKRIAALSVLLALAAAGCANTPEMIAAQLREDEAYCRSQGFQLGTDGFRLCLLGLKQIRASNAAEIAARSH